MPRPVAIKRGEESGEGGEVGRNEPKGNLIELAGTFARVEAGSRK